MNRQIRSVVRKDKKPFFYEYFLAGYEQQMAIIANKIYTVYKLSTMRE